MAGASRNRPPIPSKAQRQRNDSTKTRAKEHEAQSLSHCQFRLSASRVICGFCKKSTSLFCSRSWGRRQASATLPMADRGGPWQEEIRMLRDAEHTFISPHLTHPSRRSAVGTLLQLTTCCDTNVECSRTAGYAPSCRYLADFTLHFFCSVHPALVWLGVTVGDTGRQVLGGPSSGYLWRVAEKSGSRLARIGTQDGKT